MADINLPNVPFAADATPTGSQINDALWTPNTTPQSFNVINGQLDQANLDSGFSLGFRQTKKGTFGLAEFVGSTLNMDFFSEVFAGYRTSSWYYDPWADGSNPGTSEKTVRLPGTNTDPQRNPYLAIPNAAIRFYMERAGAVMLTWHVMWVDDQNQVAPADLDKKRQVTTPIRLFVDDEAQRAAYRLVPTTSSGFPLGRQRYWNGHHFIENLAAGWHEAYLGICVPSKSRGGYLDANIVKQARVRARGMRAIRLR
jgi:hypothetical protein